jgi:hypothetical protein
MDRRPLDLNPTLSSALVRAARAYSDIVSPPVISAALGFSVVWVDLPFWPGFAWAAAYGIIVSLIPICVVLYLLRRGLVSDLHMSNRRERHIPYLIGFVCAVLALVVVVVFSGSRLLHSLAVCNTVGLAALGAINTRWLISNHTASVMLAVTFVGFVFGITVSAALAPLVGLTFLVRLWLRRHSVAQLVAGLLVGAAPVLILANLGYLG